MEKFILDLCYRGNRNYIQGADIYLSVCDLLTKSNFNDNLSDFKLLIQKFTDKQNDIFISAPGEAIDYPEGFTARFSCNSSKGKLSGYFMENNNLVNCRYPYNEEEIKNQCLINDHFIEFQGKVSYTTIEIVVAMTKYLHMQKFKDKQGKWIISKLEIKRPFTEMDKNKISIKLIKNFSYKLTKSQIICNNEVIGDIFFSLVGEK